MNYEEIRSINLFIHSRFYYTNDDPSHDDWKSSAKQLLENPNFIIKDDCDGLASTTVHYMAIKGAKKLWRILCDSTGGTQIDHMVGMVEDDEGQRWIVGDTMDSLPCKIQFFLGRLLEFNNINNGVNWTITPQETI